MPRRTLAEQSILQGAQNAIAQLMKALACKLMLKTLMPSRIRFLFHYLWSRPRMRLVSLVTICIIVTVIATKAYITCLPTVSSSAENTITRSVDHFAASLNEITESQLAADIGFLSHNLLEACRDNLSINNLSREGHRAQVVRPLLRNIYQLVFEHADLCLSPIAHPSSHRCR